MFVIHGPAYLVGAQQNCWKCGSDNEVVTLACTAISVDGEVIDRAEPGEAFLLSYIRQMPTNLFQFVTGLAPNYKKLYSRTADEEYYANVCECGANFGDFYLFSEPDGAWFPKDDSGVATARVLPVAVADPFEVECDFGACKLRGTDTFFRGATVAQGRASEVIAHPQTAFNDFVMDVTQPERCADCENRMGGEDHGRSWHLCKFCGEAVCETCDATHFCEKQRSMKPDNVR